MEPRKIPGPSFWLEAEDAVLLEALADPGLHPDAEACAALRDRAAASVMIDPSFSYRISSLLMAALRRMGSQADDDARAYAWRCRAEACLFTGRLRQSRIAYGKACDAAQSAGDGGLRGQILVGRIHLLSLLGDAGGADQLARQAESLLKRAGDRPYLAKLHMNRGNAFYQQDRYREALAAYERAADLFAAMGQRDATWASLLMNQAIACTNLSLTEKARRLFLETEKQCHRLGQDSLLAHARFNRSFLEALHGDFREALALLETSGEAFGALDLRDMKASAERSRAEIYLELGMTEAARELAEAAATAFAAEDMQLDAALARMDAARALLEHGDFADAGARLRELDGFFSARRLAPRLAQTRLLLARTQLGLGDPSAAGKLARAALRVFISHGMDGREAAARRVLAESLLARGQGARAEKALAPALSHSAKLSLGERARLWELGGRIAARRGRRAEAGRRLRRARDLVEARRRLIPGAEFRSRAFARQKRVYAELIDWTLAGPSPRFDSLFTLVEAAGGRGFRERLGQSVRSAAATEKTAEDRARLGSLTRRIEAGELGEENVAALPGLRREARHLERKILARLRRAEGLQPGGRSWSKAASPNELARLLEPDEWLLEYSFSGDRVLALLLGHQQRSFRILPLAVDEIRGRLERVAFQFDVAALAGKAGPGLDLHRRSAERALSGLYEALLAPLSDELPSRGRLIIVAESFLHGVPFECLHDGKDYLDERFQILRSPRGDFLRRRRQKTDTRGKVLIAGLREGGPVQVEAELEAVSACFTKRGRQHHILTDPGSDDLLSALPGCQLLHLSSHGRFRADNPLFSRLSTRDGALFLADIQALDLRAELIVLSACESGKVLGDNSDDLAGVAHGFLSAGAKALLASHWRVHDEATLALMTAFYRRYLGNRRRDPAAALASAARDIRPDWPHPFFWGGFSVFGG